jgi:hypothetical protein
VSTPLPGMPEPPPRKPKAPQKPGVRATRIKVVQLCEQCCRDIHERGVWSAPYPRAARWRVVEGDSAERLCEGHKEQRCQQQ